MTDATAERVADFQTGTICANPVCRKRIPPGEVGYWKPCYWFPAARGLMCRGCALEPEPDADGQLTMFRNTDTCEHVEVNQS